MIFKLFLHKSGGEDGTVLKSEVYFADLAGHENIKLTAVAGDRLTELKNINTSLMYLQRAIHSLATSSAGKGKRSTTASSQVNFSVFRNSELTLLLANGLTGNSKAAVIVTLSPAAQHFSTSLSSIEFGLEVKGIKMDVHSTVTVDPASQIKKLEAEVKSLKAKLAAALAGQPMPPSIEGSNKGSNEDVGATLLGNPAAGGGEQLFVDLPDGAEDVTMTEENDKLMQENVLLRRAVSTLKHEEKYGPTTSGQSGKEYNEKAKPSCCRRFCYSMGLVQKGTE